MRWADYGEIVRVQRTSDSDVSFQTLEGEEVGVAHNTLLVYVDRVSKVRVTPEIRSTHAILIDPRNGAKVFLRFEGYTGHTTSEVNQYSGGDCYQVDPPPNP